MVAKTVVERVVGSDLRPSFRYCSTPVSFSPSSTPGEVDSTNEDS